MKCVWKSKVFHQKTTNIQSTKFVLRQDHYIQCILSEVTMLVLLHIGSYLLLLTCNCSGSCTRWSRVLYSSQHHVRVVFLTYRWTLSHQQNLLPTSYLKWRKKSKIYLGSLKSDVCIYYEVAWAWQWLFYFLKLSTCWMLVCYATVIDTQPFTSEKP